METGNIDALSIKSDVCFPLYAASRELIRLYTPYLDSLGLTYTQYITMNVLWEKQNVQVTTICESLALDSGTITPVLKNLESKGLLRRERSKQDERAVFAVLTEEGKALQRKAKEIPAAVSAEIMLDQTDAQELYRLLSKLLTAHGSKKK